MIFPKDLNLYKWILNGSNMILKSSVSCFGILDFNIFLYKMSANHLSIETSRNSEKESNGESDWSCQRNGP